MRVVRSFCTASLPALLLGCAGASSVSRPATAAPATSPAIAGTGEAVAQPPLRWPVRTVEHVDLWLHAFALLSEDSAAVPLYRRGYRDSLTVEKNRRNILTALDGNRETLSRGLRRSGYLNAQFLPFAFASWEEMRTTAERFLQFEGDPRRAPDRDVAQRMAVLASIFPSASDREWLRLFVAGVQDEQVRYFNAEHNALLRSRAAVITAIDSLWQQVHRAKFERFLNNTGQRQGDVLLSLPIGGEGRTSPGVTGRTMVAVTYPARVADAPEVLYVLAHEITGSLVGPAVADNVTPAEQRAGTGDRYVAIGQVQAGAMLLARVAPELVDGYHRYYLAQVGARASDLMGASLASAFATRFPLPPAIRDALTRQIDIVLSGI